MHDIKEDTIFYTNHARQQMQERAIAERAVKYCIRHGNKKTIASQNRDTYKYESLIVVCQMHTKTVITAFRRYASEATLRKRGVL